MSEATAQRQRILDAAAEILEQQGFKRLTQPEVAKVLGIRQSHLTYYFPRRADLLMALADRFLGHIAQELAEIGTGKDHAEQVLIAVNRSVTAPRGMRSFLGLLVEAEQDPALRKLLSAHMEQFVELVARELGRPADDADVRLALAALRGLALEGLLERREHPPQAAVAIGKRLGLLGSSRARVVRKPAGALPHRARSR